MAVSTTNGFDGPYTANGVTTSFPFTFTAPSADEVSVLLRDADGVESEATGYTVTLGGVSGGTVVFATAPASGIEVIPYLDPAFTQEIAFEDGSAWRASPVNEQADRAVARDQALKRDVSRAITVPLDEDGFLIPSAAVRAEKALFFDAEGNPSPISVDDFAAPAAASAAEAETLSTIIALIAAGLLFDTAADGVSGPNAVASGETFVVWADSRLRIYLNNAGTAVEKAEIATKAMLDALTLGVADDVQAAVEAALAGAGGAALVGLADGGTVEKAINYVTPEMFGAVGDGVTNDSVAVKAAIESGKIVDGQGRSYALGSSVVPTSIKGIRNCNFLWANTTVMATQAYLLSILDLSRFFVENCTFDLGTVENTGSADDSGRGGLRITTSSENVTFNDYVRVSNCRAFGKGNGTGFYLRSNRFSRFDGLIVHDRQVAYSPDPTNDCQNGIDVGKCRSVVVSNCISRDGTTRLSGTLQKRFSRGFVFVELHDSTVTGCNAIDVDQGFDFSGAITATLTQGNQGIAVSGCTASGCNTYGFKFANCSHDIAVSGCTARQFGFVGFVFAGPNSAPLNATKNTAKITLTGCHAFDPTGTFGGTNCYGFRLMQNATYSAGFPRGIKFIGCTVVDASGGGKLYQGFNSDVTYDSSGHTNEMIGCSSVGHTNAASSGFNYTVAQLPAAAPVGTRLVVTDSNSTTFNATVAGGGSSLVQVWFDGTNWKIG